jgi:hypothetical protein
MFKIFVLIFVEKKIYKMQQLESTVRPSYIQDARFLKVKGYVGIVKDQTNREICK